MAPHPDPTSAVGRVIRGARSVEKVVVGVFLSVLVAFMFILIGEPGVDWVLVAPIFVLLSTIGPVGLVLQRFRSGRKIRGAATPMPDLTPDRVCLGQQELDG